jgi:hypothetical protein
MRYSLQLNLYKKNAEKDSELVQWGNKLQQLMIIWLSFEF